MAASTATTKVRAHSRSISLPSRSHPLSASVEEHLCRLRTPEETSSSTKSKCNKLSALRDLYECVEDLLKSPVAKQDHLSRAEDILCGSIRLLDLCSTSNDALSQIRASVQDIESIFSIIRPAKETSKQNKWSKVFKSTKSKRVHCEEDREENINKVQMIDAALEALNKKSSKTIDINETQDIQKCLTALDIDMLCEEKLDCLVRSLIKMQVPFSMCSTTSSFFSPKESCIA